VFLLDLAAALPEFSNPFAVSWFLFTHGGWVIVLAAAIYGLVQLWVYWRQNLWFAKQRFVLLAIDVPRDNEQTPKAVEHIFAHIHGIHKNPNLREKYIDGYVQPSISLELISIDGYIQFLIRAPVQFRDLVEAAIYAQYPNAEISEVDDYTASFTPLFPNESYNLWGAEVSLINKDVFPIRTYPAFEHPLTQTFLDPMASLLEMMGRLRAGEQIWFQWVIAPPPNEAWRERGIRIIKKLIGSKAPSSKSTLDSLGWLPGQVFQGLTESFTGSSVFGEGATSTRNDNGPPTLMQHLPPHERNIVEAIGFKISKLSFATKFRFIYLAEHEVFNKASRIAPVWGAFKQLSALDLNGFKPDKKTKTTIDYFFKERRENARKQRLLWGYKYRSNWRGRNRYMLNTEELATLWHFPVITVKAPLVQKTQAKRGEPPIALPVGPRSTATPPSPLTPKAPPPTRLPHESSPGPVSTPTVPDNLPIA
jgi:hypothetical protein